jgi:hypothetical protein
MLRHPGGVAKGRFTVGDSVASYTPAAQADSLVFIRGMNSHGPHRARPWTNTGAMDVGGQGPALRWSHRVHRCSHRRGAYLPGIQFLGSRLEGYTRGTDAEDSGFHARIASPNLHPSRFCFA